MRKGLILFGRKKCYSEGARMPGCVKGIPF
jgi:hypothetical protein